MDERGADSDRNRKDERARENSLNHDGGVREAREKEKEVEREIEQETESKRK